tara:strand:- start:8216 stop:8623 length:408 start_codon:yes stop_codon:yes gene_type:complete
MSKVKDIIFFDGVCNLCNHFIDYVIQRDKKKSIYYCSLQSDIANSILGQFNINTEEGLNTIYYYSNSKVYSRSNAIIHIFYELSPLHKFIGKTALVIPNFIRNKIYDYIARNRYQIFGKKETCRIPKEAEKNQFL